MYYYFSSTHPAVVKINGVYLGEVHSSVKYVNTLSPSSFIEICPLMSTLSSVNFFINEEFLALPPEAISVTDMQGGYLIKYQPIATNNKFRLINQQKFPNALFSVFSENGYKLSIETSYGVYAENLDFEFDSVTFTPFYTCYDYYLAIFHGKETLVNAYFVGQETKKTLSFFCTQFSQETMCAITKYKNMAKHLLTERLLLDGELKKEKVSLTREKPLSVYTINQSLVPYAMLEELLVGGDIRDFVGGVVLENYNALPSFFGNYIGVMPPPFFRDENEVGLIYKLEERKYLVKYFTFTYTDKKITGIKQENALHEK